MKRNLVIGALLAVLVLVVQLIAGNGWGVALLSAAIAVLITLFVLAISDRYGRKQS